jgi:hypothetical protein
MSNYDSYPRTVGTDQGSGALASGGVSSVAASGGPFVPQQWSFFILAGAGGSADDVTLFAAALPVKCYVLRVEFFATATVGSGTVTLRTAAAAGGSALSAAVVAATAGAQTFSATALPTAALAAASSIYARRSDSAVAGVLTITYVPTV